MNKLLVLAAVFFTVILLSRYSEGQAPQTAAACKNPADVNPNGSSELSMLMRKMDAHAEAARKDVLAKKIAGTFPKEFLTIYTAIPTDSTTKNASFNPFADLYIQELNNFKASTSINLLQNYNSVITSCISCHSQHCPGPVSRIKKLLIAETAK